MIKRKHPSRVIMLASACMLISSRGLSGDPLAEPYLDDLNLKLLNGFAQFIFSRKKEGGWEVCIQL